MEIDLLKVFFKTVGTILLAALLLGCGAAVIGLAALMAWGTLR